VAFVFVVLIVVKADVALPVEQVHVAEITRSTAQVKLLGPECDLVVGVERRRNRHVDPAA
jgi:hypothetical protein